MARRRMIDPSIWSDERFCALNNRQRVLYLALISFADDEGMFLLNTKMISAYAFPVDKITISRINKDLNVIIKCGLLESFTSQCQEIGYHPNWTKYQKINRPTPSKFHRKCSESITTNAVSRSVSRSRLIEVNRREDLTQARPRTRERQELRVSHSSPSRSDPDQNHQDKSPMKVADDVTVMREQIAATKRAREKEKATWGKPEPSGAMCIIRQYLAGGQYENMPLNEVPAFLRQHVREERSKANDD